MLRLFGSQVITTTPKKSTAVTYSLEVNGGVTHLMFQNGIKVSGFAM